MASRRARKFPTCQPSGKTRFRTHADAVAALHAAQSSRRRAEVDNVVTKNANTRCYECFACDGGWHLTSQDEPQVGELAPAAPPVPRWRTTRATRAAIAAVARAARPSRASRPGRGAETDTTAT